MLYEDWPEHNKENDSLINNVKNWHIVSLEKLSNSIKKWQLEDSSDPDSDIDDDIMNIVKTRKRKAFKNLISGTLQQRKTNDIAASRIEIYQEHVKFKIFQAMKNQIQQSLRSKAEAQIVRETMRFEYLRKSFNAWKQAVDAPKRQILERKRQLFTAFKQACSLQLSLRIRRINLQQNLIRNRGQDLCNKLKMNLEQATQRNDKAKKYRNSQMLKNAFHGLIGHKHQEKNQKLRFQQYKMASIYRKFRLIHLSFQALQANLP